MDGSRVKTFKDIVGVIKSQFQALSKEPGTANNENLMKVIKIFPKLFD